MKALITLVLVLLMAGCAAGQDGAGRTVSKETTARHAGETTFLEAQGNPSRPPDSSLSFGRREVTGKLGSYCGTYRGSGLCADTMFLVPTRKRTLTVPSGSEMMFRYGGESPPNTVEVTAFSFNNNGDVMQRSRRGLKAQGSGVERITLVGLPPGEYVVGVFIQVRQGDATYYFRIMVE
jgi:hypothetical protein